MAVTGRQPNRMIRRQSSRCGNATQLTPHSIGQTRLFVAAALNFLFSRQTTTTTRLMRLHSPVHTIELIPYEACRLGQVPLMLPTAD